MHDFSSVNYSNTNNTKISDEEAKLIIEKMELNRLRKKEGLDPILFVPPSHQQQPQKQETVVEKIEEKKATESSITTNQSPSYSYFQSQIQGQLMSFQANRFSQIANSARKEKHVIYKFDGKPSPPKLGEKKHTRQTLIPIDVYYNELPNDIHYQLDALRARVTDLQLIKSQQVPAIDADGRSTPPLMTTNNPDRTDLTDKEFYHISEVIDTLNKKVAAMMAEWYYGIKEDLLPQLENTSLSAALEAGLYREMYGLVNDSKNSGVS